MPTSNSEKTLAVGVFFGADSFVVALRDGRRVSIPYTWYPRLIGATVAQLHAYELSYEGVHWDGLDEDISVLGLLEGKPDGTAFARRYWEAHPEQRPKVLFTTTP
ncbi:MAG: DUF2442 domain-containing protein [Rhizobacter sp.]|nr:DUF2442 domain-containing protein [Chlorobiales bacterium]